MESTESSSLPSTIGGGEGGVELMVLSEGDSENLSFPSNEPHIIGHGPLVNVV